jgi:hypothetical protein
MPIPTAGRPAAARLGASRTRAAHPPLSIEAPRASATACSLTYTRFTRPPMSLPVAPPFYGQETPVGDEQIDVTRLPVDVWLDDAGRVRRVILHSDKQPLDTTVADRTSTRSTSRRSHAMLWGLQQARSVAARRESNADNGRTAAALVPLGIDHRVLPASAARDSRDSEASQFRRISGRDVRTRAAGSPPFWGERFATP